MRQVTVIMLVFFMSCATAVPSNDRQKIDKDSVDYVEIRKQFDTVSLRLTADQAAGFIDVWHHSSSKGVYKFLPEYFLTIHFIGGRSRSYRVNGSLVKQGNDWTYSVGDKEYFKNIWYQHAGLTREYFEYFPIYNKSGGFLIDRSPLTEKHRNAIKQVLTYYDHKWLDIRGMIFYEQEIDSELLWNYTTKANDSAWLSLHK